MIESRQKAKLYCAVGGAALGGWLGSSIGIVGYGSGIAGTIPLAVVGGYAGYRLGSLFPGSGLGPEQDANDERKSDKGNDDKTPKSLATPFSLRLEPIRQKIGGRLSILAVIVIFVVAMGLARGLARLFD